jgi:hypothetical protein
LNICTLFIRESKSNRRFATLAKKLREVMGRWKLEPESLKQWKGTAYPAIFAAVKESARGMDRTELARLARRVSMTRERRIT